MNDVRLKISPPWITYINEMEQLFDGDPQIVCHVNYSSDNPYIVLACNNGDKVAALQQILPMEVRFGDIILEVGVSGTPSNRAFKSKKELFDAAFEGNPVYAYSVSPADEGYEWFTFTYCVFKNRVCQFFADNLNDCHGVISTLYEEIARDVLTGEGAKGVYFNTDVEVGKLGKPLNEWP